MGRGGGYLQIKLVRILKTLTLMWQYLPAKVMVNGKHLAGLSHGLIEE